MNELTRFIVGQLVIPYFSLGMVAAGFFLFLNTVTVFPERRYFSILFITSISFLYLFFEIGIIQTILMDGTIQRALFLDRMKKMVRLFYLAAVPFFLHEFVFVSPLVNRIHRLLLIIMSIAVPFFLTVGILRPDLYVDPYKESGLEGIELLNSLKNEQTRLFLITEGILFILLFYTMIILIISLIRNSKARDLRILLLGTLFSNYFFIAAIWKTFTGEYLPPFRGLVFSRVNMGLGVLTFFIYLGIFRFFLKRSREVSDTKDQLFKSQKELIRMAYTDNLTQVGNRLAYQKELENLLKKKDLKSAVIQMDIDRFMELNESYGNDTGDQILKILGRRFKENLPPFVKIYRIGGDEFAFVLTQISSDEVPVEIAILLQNWMNQGVTIDGENFSLNGSLGICYIPNQGMDLHGVSMNLNCALKTAKIRGRRIEVFNQSMQHQSKNRINTVKALKTAIREKDFYLVYQPILDSQKQVVGAEALLRWNNPSMGFQNPQDFIPIAESAGLMDRLGFLILETFIEDYIKMREQVAHLFFSINISPMQFQSSTLCDQILFLFSKNDIPLDRVYFEITEVLFSERWQPALETLNCFRSKGIKIALDDFGSGYSSLRYMQELPVDSLKIDKSFLTQIPRDVNATTILRTILQLAKTFNLESVAEGVEREEQFRFLKSEGCHHFQGFHFHHPLTREGLVKQLES